MFKIDRIDHIVLTVRDIEVTCNFYERVLGMQIVTFGANRKALKFGNQKINLQQLGAEIDPKAALPTPGSADLCLITNQKIETVVEHLTACGVSMELEPVQRVGATGPILSVYFRDPDQNLVEISQYVGLNGGGC